MPCSECAKEGYNIPTEAENNEVVDYSACSAKHCSYHWIILDYKGNWEEAISEWNGPKGIMRRIPTWGKKTCFKPTYPPYAIFELI